MLGIDFGATHTRAAVIVDGEPRAVVDVDGTSEIPTVVAFASSGRLVGGPALRQAAHDPTTAVRGVKRLLGARADDPAIANLIRTYPNRIDVAPDGGLNILIGAAQFTPIEIASFALEYIGNLARQQYPGDIGAVVVTAPTWFTKAQRTALSEAALQARLPVQRVLSEPAAVGAALAHLDNPSRATVIVDAGACGTSASVVEVKSTSVTLMSTIAQGAVGGEEIDRAIQWTAIQQISAHRQIPNDVRTIELMRRVAEMLKRDLTTAATAARPLPLPPAGYGQPSPSYGFDRQRLEYLMTDLLNRLDACVGAAIGASGLAPTQVETLLLNGAMAADPAIVARVERFFGRPAKRGPAIAPLAAYGAAIVAGGISGELSPMLVEEADWTHWLESADPPPSAFARGPRDDPSVTSMVTERSESRTGSGGSDATVPTTPTKVDIDALREAGTFVNPSDAKAVYALPVARRLKPSDVNPISLAGLLVQVMSKKSNSGMLTLTFGVRAIEVPIINGRLWLNPLEQSGLMDAVKTPEGSYTFEEGRPATKGRKRTSMIQLAFEGARHACRNLTQEDIENTLGNRVRRAPKLYEDLADRLTAIGLTSAEARFVNHAFDGTKTATEIATMGGITPRAALLMMFLLDVFGCIKWATPLSSPDALGSQLDELADEKDKGHHFNALDVPVTASTEEIHAAYKRLLKAYGDGTDAYKANADACRRIAARALVAYNTLSDAERRADHLDEIA